MKNQYDRLLRVIKNEYFLVFFVAILTTFVIFRKFIFYGFIPIPLDALVGIYYPWLDYSWGYPVSVPVRNNLPSDVFSLIYPWRILGIDLIKQGIVPLWDNHILLGTPLLANFQSALLNPINILYWLFSNTIAWGVQVVLQLMLLLFSTFYFLRSEKFTVYSSIFGALLFSLSGYVLAWIEYNSIVYTLVYFPLILIFSKKFAQDKEKIKWFLLLSITVCLQLLSGYPLLSLYSLLIGFAYFVFNLNLKSKNYLGNILPIITAFLLGILMSGVQILPGIENAHLSVRQFDTTAEAGDIKFLPIAHVLSFFIPDFFGNPGTMNYWSVGSYDNFAYFISSTGIYFLLLSIINKQFWDKKIRFFSFLLMFTLILVFKTPISDLMLNIPGFSGSTNTRLLFIISFSASIVSAFVFENIINKKFKYNFFLLFSPVFIFAIFPTSALLGKYFYSQQLELLNQYREVLLNLSINDKLLESFYSETAKKAIGFNTAFRNTAIPSVIILATAAAVYINRSKILTLGLISLTILSFVTVSDKYLSFTEPGLIYPETQVINKLQDIVGQNRFSKEDAEIFPPNTWIMYGLKTPDGQSVFAPISTSKYINLISKASANESLLNRFNSISNFNSPLIHTLNIEYYLALNRDEIESVPSKKGRPFPWTIPDSFEEVENIGSVRIYKNKDNLGPAWFAEKIIGTNNFSDTANILLSDEFNPLRMVGVEGAEASSHGSYAEVISYEEIPNSVKIIVDSDEPRFLTISKSNYPGWLATVNGKSVPTYKANEALTAVLVPAGNSTVDLIYKPKSFIFGFWLSVLGWFFWFVVYFRYAKKL